LPLLKLKSQTLVIDGDHCKGTDVYLRRGSEGGRCISYTPAPHTLTNPSDIQDITKTIIFTRHDVGFILKQLDYNCIN